MNYHRISFLAGFILDQILGDPYRLPHPIRLIGGLIQALDQKLLKKEEIRNEKKEKKKGVFLVAIVLLATLFVSGFLLIGAYCIHPVAGIVMESIMTYQILAVKSLKTESMKVYECLKNKDLEGAKKAVSMIVGRDTENLNEAGICRTAVETVAENTSDGVIAPMLYTAALGPMGGFLYKAINTMDSMIGYKNARYLYLGRAAAKLDDLVNYIPARVCAVLMIVVSFLPGTSFLGKNARKIYRRDRKKHASPNSAQTESVCAGALGIRLAGNASYFGKVVEKPYIGDPLKETEYTDIKRANHMLYLTAWMCEGICLIILWMV